MGARRGKPWEANEDKILDRVDRGFAGAVDQIKEGLYTPEPDPPQTSHTLTRDVIKGIPVSSAPFTPNRRVRPHTADLLSLGHHIILDELMRLREKSESGEGLTPAETKQMEGYVRSLKDLMKMERDEARANDPSQMSDEELMAEAKKILKLKGGEDAL